MWELTGSDLRTINVVGSSGSGKSTLGRKIAAILGLRYIEMDALFWGPNWEQSKDEVFFSKVAAAISEEGWVLDGNYSRTFPIKWPKTSLVVWLDYSLSRTIFRSVKRALSRAITQKELWPGTGNRESFRKLLSRESIILFAIKSHRSVRPRYESHMKNPEYPHIKFVRLRTPKEAERFLQALADLARKGAGI